MKNNRYLLEYKILRFRYKNFMLNIIVNTFGNSTENTFFKNITRKHFLNF